MRTSKIISIALHPIFVPSYTLCLTLYFFQSETKYIIDISEKTHYFLFLVVFTIILPVISMLLLLKNKKISSLELYDKSERGVPILLTLFYMLICFYSLKNLLTENVANNIVLAEVLGASITMFAALLISVFWKISLHMMAGGGCLGVVSLLTVNSDISDDKMCVLLAVVVFLNMVLAYCRVLEKAHNKKQILIGFLIGFIILFFIVGRVLK